MGCFQWFAESHEKHKHEQAFLIGSRMLGSWGQAVSAAPAVSSLSVRAILCICSIW
jgi:hypothetical protein